MISRTVRKIDHLPCPCGHSPSLMQVEVKGTTRYYVEAPCCKMATLRLRSEEGAVYEFQRLRAVLEQDEYCAAAKLDPMQYHPNDEWEGTRGYICSARGLQ